MTHELVAINQNLTDALKSVGVIGKNDRLISAAKIFDSGRCGESWVYGYSIKYCQSPFSLRRAVNIKEKNMISIALSPATVAQHHLTRASYLSDQGFRIPKIYGVHGGALYQEFIVNDKTAEILQNIEENPKALDELIDIASRLDRLGFQPTNFVSDLIYDGDKKHFFLTDVGFDLGPPQNKRTYRAHQTLIERFPRARSYIEAGYR